MNKLISFVKEFTKEHIPELENVEKIGRNYFLIEKELKELKQKIELEPFSAGLPMGEIKNKDFMPSIALLDILCRYSGKKVVINKKGETMFLYKKDVFGENVVQGKKIEGLVLVMNEQNECLGYGNYVKKSKGRILKKALDRGDFLRREQ
ncbi:MAG: hypothetical protein KKF46_02060 [Nanoarchaeota archaeon]|nr:hypothetical protein [Nanoarchaeota archaeon]MBU1321118.1 hypothetical protein [Nanoarchaeota archaeon]MBU1598410.1 hypothetical protein [Nanoarchaeota archaeon]MBU2440875.1 hypothetical protein [Nanoarchaeota archaeon]